MIGALVVVIAAVGGALGGGSDTKGGGKSDRAAHRSAPAKKVPASYEIQDGDTLLAIAHRTDVPVARIERLNPQVDPLGLIAGETLKLR